jgi:serine/threonine-protein kinase
MLAGDSAMVLDFGLARAVKVATNERLTMAGEVIGTPAYMSPEQAMGKWMIDAKTDIYSLGCVLYEMLVGTSPFEGARSDAVMVRRLNDPVPRVLDARADAPAEVDAVLAKALEWKPEARWADAGAFRDAIRAVPRT